MPVDALHRQADEGPHPDAGHRPRQPRLSRARTAASSWTTTACSRACARRWRSMPSATTDDGGGERDRGADRGAGAGAARGDRSGGEASARASASIPAGSIGAKGFDRIEALRDAVDALYTSDEAKRRFEIMARQVFIRFKALLMEPSAFAYAERHDNIEAIYKKLTGAARHGRRDRGAQGAAPDRQRGHPRAGAGRGPRRRADGRPEPDRLREAARRVREEGAAQARRACRTSATSSRRSWRRCWRAIRCGWTTTRSTRRSSPTTTARRIA